MTSFRERVRHSTRQIDRDGTNLLARLDVALDRHLRGDTRAAAICALSAVIGSLEEKFDEAGLGIDRTIPLRKLRDALHDLDRGVVPDMLRPANRGGGPTPPTAEELNLRTIAVLMVETGRAEGRFETLAQGYRAVADDVRRVTGHEVSRDMVRRWRDKITEDESDNAFEYPATDASRITAAAMYRNFADVGFTVTPYDDLLQALKKSAEQAAKAGEPLA